MNFENAPFKLTREYVELLGGLDSDNMRMFQDLFMRGFFALQQHTEGLAAIWATIWAVAALARDISPARWRALPLPCLQSVRAS